MPSPFPGMNPYLEQDHLWPQFHQQLCTRCMEVLVPQVRPSYYVKLEEHVYIHEFTDEERVLVGRPDVVVAERKTGPVKPTSSAATLEAPLEVMVPPNTYTDRIPYLEIRARDDHALVAVIELLSPANKRIGPDREAFLVKRRRLLASPAHYVEIDLLRGGPRLPIDGMPSCDYYVLVSRYERRPTMGMWALRLRDRLPVFPVPLREPKPDARVDLQALLHDAYDAAGYADYIYAGQPQPRLHPDDEAWAGQLLHGT